MNPTTPPDDGGPAFPRSGMAMHAAGTVDGVPYHTTATITSPADGMTLRDWFAGQVLASLIARNTFGPIGVQARHRYEGWDLAVEEMYAAVSYRAADAMLAERRTSRIRRAQYPEGKDDGSETTGGTS